MQRWLRLAYKKAKTSNHPHHKVGAVVVRSGAVISAASNFYRQGHCAERRALRPGCAERGDYSGGVLYCVRANKRISKPCEDCMEAIRRAGIVEVVFVDLDGDVRRLSVRS